MSNKYRAPKSLGFASNTSQFERRGDPWVSQKEGMRDYGRNIQSENPDFDRYFAEASKQGDTIRRIRSYGNKIDAEIDVLFRDAEKKLMAHRKRTQISYKMNKKLMKLADPTIKIK